MRKTEAIAEAALKKQEASPDLLSNRTGSSHAMAYARKLEKARREWVMAARPDDRFAQAELLDKCPKVTVVPVEV